MKLRTNKMKTKPTLGIALIATILFEIIVMFLVYNKIGGHNVPTQIIRLALQMTLFLILFKKSSKITRYILTVYHVMVAIPLLQNTSSLQGISLYILIYHIILTVMIFFSVNIDWWLFKNRQ